MHLQVLSLQSFILYSTPDFNLETLFVCSKMSLAATAVHTAFPPTKPVEALKDHEQA